LPGLRVNAVPPGLFFLPATDCLVLRSLDEFFFSIVVLQKSVFIWNLPRRDRNKRAVIEFAKYRDRISGAETEFVS